MFYAHIISSVVVKEADKVRSTQDIPMNLRWPWNLAIRTGHHLTSTEKGSSNMTMLKALCLSTFRFRRCKAFGLIQLHLFGFFARVCYFLFSCIVLTFHLFFDSVDFCFQAVSKCFVGVAPNREELFALPNVCTAFISEA